MTFHFFKTVKYHCFPAKTKVYEDFLDYTAETSEYAGSGLPAHILNMVSP